MNIYNDPIFPAFVCQVLFYVIHCSFKMHWSRLNPSSLPVKKVRHSRFCQSGVGAVCKFVSCDLPLPIIALAWIWKRLTSDFFIYFAFFHTIAHLKKRIYRLSTSKIKTCSKTARRFLRRIVIWLRAPKLGPSLNTAVVLAAHTPCVFIDPTFSLCLTTYQYAWIELWSDQHLRALGFHSLVLIFTYSLTSSSFLMT